MGSSGLGSALDCGVGSIVWVRRRNGSWWPGRILGPGDLSTSNLTSPRSGTPVKLLGREDASIDWYNLEKSKRVKAFRCGEFDDCIEKAEASQGLPPKKREKYARREDAILHALELERQLLRKQGKLPDLVSNRSLGTEKKELGPLSDKLENDDGIFRGSKASKVIRSCQPSHKGDLETAPRMKGLRDFGLRVAPQKRKFSSIASDDTCKVDNNSQALTCDVSFGNTRGINGMELRGASLQANRSTNSMEYSKEIPLNLVEKAHPHFQEYNHPHPGSTAKINPSRLLEESESDSSDTESDSTETEPDIDWGMSVQSDISLPLESDRRPGAPALEESSEDYDGSSLSGEMTNVYPHDHVSASRAVSKWQLKGKRNIRLTKRHVDATRSSFNMYTGSTRKILPKNSGYYRKEDFIDHDDDDMDFYPEDTRMEWSDIENREYMFTPRSVSNYRNSLGRDLIDLELEHQAVVKGHWEDRWGQLNPMYTSHHYYGGRMRPMLIDVDLEVKGAGYKKESVPLISMTSKVSGQPIIGHPIQIEVLEDGATDNLISNNVGFGYDIIDHKGIATLPPAWKTARRTANSRVPRPHVSSTLDGYRYTEELSPSDQEMEKPIERSSPMKKRRLDVPQLENSRTYTGKAPKKVSSGQRTRTLSSIAADRKYSSKHVHGCINSRIDGVGKPPSHGPRSVALIPCKLVFSRLLEKINRPPMKANNSAVLDRLPL